MLAGLPPGSALHRAQAEGKTWSLPEQILWHMLGQMVHLNGQVRSLRGVRSEQDKFKWPATPWDDKDQDKTKYGSLAPEDQEAGINYLAALHPADNS